MAKRKHHGGNRSARGGQKDANAPSRRRRGGKSHGRAGGDYWIFGSHAVLSALANPDRRVRRALATAESARRLPEGGVVAADVDGGAFEPQIVPREVLDQTLSEGAVHQGMALLVSPLQPADLADLLPGKSGDSEGRTVFLVLDQVTDPQNVGAILRSASAFGAKAVIGTADHAAPESGTLAKAASGALEHLPYLRVTNMARTLDALKAAQVWCVGMSGESTGTLAEVDPGGALALVLGAEGSGLRRLTRESCDLLARLPTQGPVATLNVSNAAAVALYAVLKA